MKLDLDEWWEAGLQQTAPNGTKVGVRATKDAKAFAVQFETLTEGEEPHITEFCVSEATLATMLVVIAKLTGLWVPGIGIIRIQNRNPDLEGSDK